MPLPLLVTLGAVAYLALTAVLIAAGCRWQTAKPHATHTPPTTTPEEGNQP